MSVENIPIEEIDHNSLIKVKFNSTKNKSKCMFIDYDNKLVFKKKYKDVLLKVEPNRNCKERVRKELPITKWGFLKTSYNKERGIGKVYNINMKIISEQEYNLLVVIFQMLFENEPLDKIKDVLKLYEDENYIEPVKKVKPRVKKEKTPRKKRDIYIHVAEVKKLKE
jgi:hypothetical protein